MKALARRDVASVRVLLAAGANPNARVSGKGESLRTHQSLPERATALHLATCLGEPEFISALHSAGAVGR
jgi:ankyrin repeat protein